MYLFILLIKLESFLVKTYLELWTTKYKILILVFIQIKNNLNLHPILSTTEIFPISWGGLGKGFYGNTLVWIEL